MSLDENPEALWDGGGREVSPSSLISKLGFQPSFPFSQPKASNVLSTAIVYELTSYLPKHPLIVPLLHPHHFIS